jgi:hypothetical protein
MNWKQQAEEWEYLAATHPDPKVREDCRKHAEWCRAHQVVISQFPKNEKRVK